MFKKSNLIASAAYVSPMCKFVTTHPRKMLCGSPWGEEGEAGKIGDYEEGEDL